jgi:hypothetical protein
VDGSDFVLWSMSMLIVARWRIGLTRALLEGKGHETLPIIILLAPLLGLVGWLDVRRLAAQKLGPLVELRGAC